MNSLKKVLLYLGKFPGYGFDIDGGSILARQLIDTLKTRCNLDVVFIRKNKEVFEDKFVRNVRYVKYKNAFNDKFTRRLENLETNVVAIGDYTNYDIIITAHVSKFFGFHNAPDSFWEKTILFPMFCTSSYIRAGECIPQEYTNQEHLVFKHVNKIICPSLVEKSDISKDYNVGEEKIFVIPRGINPVFTSSHREISRANPNIVCIGSIKKQKNSMDALKVLSYIREYGMSAEMHFVCTIQDKNLYTEMLRYIEDSHLSSFVHYHIGLSQNQVAEIMKKMDINISVSNWETFGRGIFEGISSGLPTFVYSKLIGIKELCAGCIGVSFSNDAEEMARNIVLTLSDSNLYNLKVESLVSVASKVSYSTEQNNLLKVIL